MSYYCEDCKTTSGFVEEIDGKKICLACKKEIPIRANNIVKINSTTFQCQNCLAKFGDTQNGQTPICHNCASKKNLI